MSLIALAIYDHYSILSLHKLLLNKKEFSQSCSFKNEMSLVHHSFVGVRIHPPITADPTHFGAIRPFCCQP
jgi:hypothetical protein